MPTPGCATADGTALYKERRLAEHFRRQQGLWLSSVGIGTYLGQPDEATDQAYTAAVTRAIELGVNVIDTAINYRFQRSERSIGAALCALHSSGRVRREEVLVCTKAGFLTPDGEMPANPQQYFRENYLERGILSPGDIVGGVHCMTPRYLEDQLDRSLRNLDLECVDVFYLHNPETQLSAVRAEEFLGRVRSAFEMLERKVSEGKIQWYGMATWNALRQPRGARDSISLEEVAGVAEDLAGESHHFRFVQLPFNLAMPEAFSNANQLARGRNRTLLETARELGITVVASASLMQASLTSDLPDIVRGTFRDLDTDAQRALQFVRSTPGIAVALVGMSDVAHVEENLRLCFVPPVPESQYLKLFERS